MIVLGGGKIAVECLKLLINYPGEIIAIEQEEQSLSFVRFISNQYNLTYHLIPDHQELSAYLSNIEEETLVVSVNNNYIFPQPIVNKKNFSIINFHNALLPNYPGRNAPTWVIFNEEQTTGVTWHMVEKGVDTGKILMQKTIIIDPSITALELTKQCMNVGIESFRKILPEVLAGRFTCYAQDTKQRKNFHNAAEIPNHGYMEVSWPTAKISAFLRSLDYGKIKVFPSPKVIVLGQEYLIRKYGISLEATLGCHVNFQKNEIVLQDYRGMIRIGIERGRGNGANKDFA